MASESRERDRDRGEWDESVMLIRRCAPVVKGGRRFSFNALVVVGNRRGQVGWGYGKANEVPPAVEKGVKDAHKQMKKVQPGGDDPARAVGHFGAAKVLLFPPARYGRHRRWRRACRGRGRRRPRYPTKSSAPPTSSTWSRPRSTP